MFTPFLLHSAVQESLCFFYVLRFLQFNSGKKSSSTSELEG